MKKSIVGIAVLLIILSLQQVSANYILLKQLVFDQTVSDGNSLAIDFSTMPWKAGEGFKIYIDGSGAFSSGMNSWYSIVLKFDSDVITIKAEQLYDSTNDKYTETTKVILNGVEHTIETSYPADPVAPFDVVVIEFLNSTTVKVTKYAKDFLHSSILIDEADITLNLTSLPSQLTSIEVKTDSGSSYTLSKIQFYRYSAILSSLNVFDEETNAKVAHFDFSETNDTVRVFDPTGEYIARSYLASPNASLDAYLLKYIDGHWYTLQAEPNSTIEVLRSYENVKKVVAVVTTDQDGQAGVFLADGVIYTFRVTGADGSVSEYNKIATPSSLTIVLSNGLSANTTYKTTSLAYVSYTFEPYDRILYIGQNNTVEAKVSSSIGNIANATFNFYKNGILINSTSIKGSPTGGVMKLGVGGNFSTLDYLTGVLTIYTTDNKSITVSQAYIPKAPLNASNTSLFHVAAEVPEKLGIGQLGIVIILTFIALALAVVVGAGERGSIIVVIMVYIAATVLGWINWIITMFTALAGIGVLLRRGEA